MVLNMTSIRHDFDVRIVLDKPLMAHLASNSPKGPRDSPLWFLWEEDAIWLIGNSNDTFPRRLEAEPRCAVGIVDYQVERGILRHVGVRGMAQVHHEMDRSRLHRLLHRYLGPNVELWNPWFVEHVVDKLDRMICITPSSVVAKDMSYFQTGPMLATHT